MIAIKQRLKELNGHEGCFGRFSLALCFSKAIFFDPTVEILDSLVMVALFWASH